MKKTILILCLLAAFFTFRQMYAENLNQMITSAEYNAFESISMNLVNSPKEWKLIRDKQLPSGMYIQTWGHEEQSEVLAFQFIGKADLNCPAVTVMEATRENMQKGDVLNVISESANDVMFEFIRPHPYKHMSPHTDIIREIETDRGLHSIVYSKKGESLSSVERAQWIECIQKAQIIK